VLCTSLLTAAAGAADPAPPIDSAGVVCATPVDSDALWSEFDRLDTTATAAPDDPPGDCGSCTEPVSTSYPAPPTAPVTEVTAPAPESRAVDSPRETAVEDLLEATKADEDPKGVGAVTWTVDDKLTRALRATEWGLTQPQRTKLDITAFCKGDVWKNVVSTADGLVHTKARLLANVVEVTAEMVAAEKSCDTLSRMATSLTNVADGKDPLGYYMLAAVQAHENLHVTHFKTAVDAAFATFKTAVEGLTIPKGNAKNAAEAATMIKALPAYTAALTAFQAAETKAAADTAAHKPAGDFPKAEHAVVDPMIKKINDRRAELKC
jgi:hypothetical protein